MIIALGGEKGSGKDTAAEALVKRQGFVRIALADKLKDICHEITGISRTDMDDAFLKEKPFETPFIINTLHLQDLIDIIERDGFVVTEDNYKFIFKEFNDKHILSIRHLLQVVGTDILRMHVSDTIWLEYFTKTLKKTTGNVVVTDARFKNERDYMKSLGAILILIRRIESADSAVGLDFTKKHISENQLGNEQDYDVIIRNVACIHAVQSDISLWYTLKYKYANTSSN